MMKPHAIAAAAAARSSVRKSPATVSPTPRPAAAATPFQPLQRPQLFLQQQLLQQSSRSRSFATTATRLATWGFIGLGKMGYPMAKNLRTKIPSSDTLVIYDRNEDATTRFVQELGKTVGEGIEVASSVRSVAEKAEVTITTLPESSHVKNVFHHILHPSLPPLPPSTSTHPIGGTKHERLFIDCSTIDPTSSREVANAVHSTAQGRFVDAPMSGGVVGAQAATLTFMLGFSSRSGGLLHRITPVLELMGQRVIHLGGQGAGLAGKLANNYLLAISNIATAEAMNLGVRGGLDPAVLAHMINTSSGRCWSSEVNNPVPGVSPGAPAERGFEGGFGVELMAKDLRLAMEEARRVGAKVEMGERAGDVYELVGAAGGRGKDFSVVYRWLGAGGRKEEEQEGEEV